MHPLRVLRKRFVPRNDESTDTHNFAIFPSFLPLHRRRNNATADLLVGTENAFGRLGLRVPRKSEQGKCCGLGLPGPKEALEDQVPRLW
jgi:hypothetical protein